MDSGRDLPPHQPAQSCFIEREVILKWSNQCRTATCEHDVPPYRSCVSKPNLSAFVLNPIGLRSREIRTLRFSQESSAPHAAPRVRIPHDFLPCDEW